MNSSEITIGYKYFIFCPTDKFENKSSIKEINKKGSVIND